MPLEPPACANFPTFEDGLTAWQTHALEQGYVIKKAGCTDKRDGEYTRYTLRCTAGSHRLRDSRASRSVTSTADQKCPFQAVAKLYKYADTWCFDVKNSNHNHEPTYSTPSHRQEAMTPAVTRLIDDGMDQLMPRRHIYRAIRAFDVDTSIKNYDISNYMARRRRNEQGAYSDCAQIIHLLEQEKVWHQVDYEDKRVYRIIWSFDWCQSMWKRSPEVLLIDSTYKVNSFEKPFFEIVGTTSMNTTFNIAFAILSDESEESHTWAMRQIEALRYKLAIPTPLIAITDKDDGLRNAIRNVWPATQLQLCIWHIMTNVRAGVRTRWSGAIPKGYKPLGINELLAQKWIKPAHMSGEAFEALAPPVPPTIGEVITDRQRRQRREADNLPPIDHDINGLLTLWGYLSHSKQESEALRHWDDLCSEFFDQPRVLAYLGSTYWQYRTQWAYCYIREYRNYGIRSTSRVESAHAQLKSYLRNPWSSVVQLYKATLAMISEKRDQFEKNEQHQVHRSLMMTKAAMFADQSLKLGISWYALQKAYEQYQVAVQAHREGTTLERCTTAFKYSMGIPCRHIFYSRMYSEAKRGGKRVVYVKPSENLKISDFHTHWWLQLDVAAMDPLLLIGDFQVSRTTHTQPRKPVRNQPITTIPRFVNRPTSTSSYFQHPDGKRIPSWWEQVLQEGASQPSRKLPASIVGSTSSTRNSAPSGFHMPPEITDSLLPSTVGSMSSAKTSTLHSLSPSGFQMPPEITNWPTGYAVPDETDGVSVNLDWLLDNETIIPPSSAPQRREESPPYTYDDPKAIYQRYVSAREKWIATQMSTRTLTDQDYRKAMSLPLKYKKASYEYCRDYKRMGRRRISSNGPSRDWTEEEMRAYLDWDRSQNEAVEADIAQLSKNGLSNRKGMTELWAMAERFGERQAQFYSTNAANS